MVGAYQEILGDIHNLFGDTDAVEVRIESDGYVLSQQRRGDRTDVILDYVGYSIEELRQNYRDKTTAAGLGVDEAARLSAALDAGLAGYPYLSAAVLEDE